MFPESRAIALQIAATLSYYVARNVRIDSESSKLLILSPHSDTISDLEDVLGASATDLPPTLYDFYLVTLYRIHYLPSRLAEFPKRNHNNQWVDPKPDSITNLAIHSHIKDDALLIQELEALATLPAIVKLVKDFPRFFTSYCTLSNTVKAIGIGGTASLFLSIKMSGFLANSREAEARNLVALTRSKGLCVVLLPFTDRFPSTHSALCAPTAKVSSQLVRPASTIKPWVTSSLNLTPLWKTSPQHLMTTVGRSLTKSLTSALGAFSPLSWVSLMALPPTSSTSPLAPSSLQVTNGRWMCLCKCKLWPVLATLLTTFV